MTEVVTYRSSPLSKYESINLDVRVCRDGGYLQVLRLAKNGNFPAHTHNVLWINLYKRKEYIMCLHLARVLRAFRSCEI